jgi:hypothetical protein
MKAFESGVQREYSSSVASTILAPVVHVILPDDET